MEYRLARAVLDEAAQAALAVLGCEAPGDHVGLKRETVLDRQGRGGVERPLRIPQRERAAGGAEPGAGAGGAGVGEAETGGFAASAGFSARHSSAAWPVIAST